MIRAVSSVALEPVDAPGARMERSERMLRFAREVFETLELDAVLLCVLEMTREVTDSRYAVLGVSDDSQDDLEEFITVGTAEGRRRQIVRLPHGLEEFAVGGHDIVGGVPILVDGTAFGELYVAGKRIGRFDAADDEAMATIAGWGALAIRNALAYESAVRRGSELEQSVDALSATMDIALALGGETQLETLLEMVVTRGRALVSAGGMAVGLLAGEELVISATAGNVPPRWRSGDIPLNDGVIGAAVRLRRVQRLEGGALRRSFGESGMSAGAARAGLVVPMLFRDQVLGVLVAFDRIVAGPAFGAGDERLLQAFATTAAAALSTAHTVAEDLSTSRLAASEAERKRWARELHDETLQSLAMLRMTLSGAQRRGTVDVLQDTVAMALTNIDAQIVSLRGLIAELRPAVLDDVGVGPALEAFIERAARLGARIELSVDLDYEAGRSSRRHPPDLEATLYRIAQEAINNAVKHSGAAVIRVSVREQRDAIEVRVEDDGSGFEPHGKSGGFGLTGMRERTNLAGGQLQVTSSPGSGTCIVARLPVTGGEKEVRASRTGPGAVARDAGGFAAVDAAAPRGNLSPAVGQ